MTERRDARRIIVCGSRHYSNRSQIRAVLSEFVPAEPWADEPTIVHGACRGADKLAAEEALDLGLWVEAHPADWSRGGRAGPERNQAMAGSGADLCLAFGDGRGTRNMIAAAEAHGVPVERYP